MINITVFGEDYAHEVVLHMLLQRFAADHNLPVEIHVRSAAGGHARMIRELEQYRKELERGQARLPDLFVVARDANCAGYAQRVKEITATLEGYKGMTVQAVPDPHVERWLLIDSKAFKIVLGHGCQAPDQKCNRDRYKALLDQAVRIAGVEPLLGGVEFAEDIVRVMNLDHAGKLDSSFGHLLQGLRAAFQQWKPK
jgi:hypothetical protein